MSEAKPKTLSNTKATSVSAIPDNVSANNLDSEFINKFFRDGDKLMSEAKKEIVDKAIQTIKEEIGFCGVPVNNWAIELCEYLVEEDKFISFTLSIQLEPFNTDEGKIKPQEIIMQIDHHYAEEYMYIITGEDTEWDLDAKNIFAYMYFNSLEQSANDLCRQAIENAVLELEDKSDHLRTMTLYQTADFLRSHAQRHYGNNQGEKEGEK